jgi:hypothetical protein
VREDPLDRVADQVEQAGVRAMLLDPLGDPAVNRLAYQSRPRSQFISSTKKLSSFGFDIWISGCRPR